MDHIDRTNHATAGQVAQRVELVIALLLAGRRAGEICRWATTTSEQKTWRVSESQARKYILRANKALRQASDRSIAGRLDDWMAQALAQRDYLYARAVQAKDNRTALAALDSREKLRGLFQTTVVETKEGDTTTTRVNGPETLTLYRSVVDALVAEAEAGHAGGGSGNGNGRK